VRWRALHTLAPSRVLACPVQLPTRRHNIAKRRPPLEAAPTWKQPVQRRSLGPEPAPPAAVLHQEHASAGTQLASSGRASTASRPSAEPAASAAATMRAGSSRPAAPCWSATHLASPAATSAAGAASLSCAASRAAAPG
jgi:hypothetical protein